MRRLIFKNVARGRLTEPAPAPDEAALAELAANLGRVARKKLGRSLAIREVDAGSCNACELEIHALNNAFYDLERFGILSFDSWRAGRLVVDTGMHALGWSRQQAIDYLVDNSPQAPNNIANEVDRYIGYTGQALAYKVGQLKIREIRASAEERLGDKFDIKAFHTEVLRDGSMPLSMLQSKIDRWVDSHL